MNIILLGAPGSGKGTSSELLVDNLGFIQLSTGDLFRNNINSKSALGIKAQKFMFEGKLVPDNVTNAMVNKFLTKVNDNLIFDGFPRTHEQAIELDKMLKDVNQKIDLVICIEINESLLIERLTGRIMCPKCKRSFHKRTRKPKIEWICDFDNTELVSRPDDQEEKIITRLEAYESQTKPLINFYELQKKLIRLDANDLAPNQMLNKLKEIIS